MKWFGIIKMCQQKWRWRVRKRSSESGEEKVSVWIERKKFFQNRYLHSKKLSSPVLATIVSPRRSASSRRESDSGSGSVSERVSSAKNTVANAFVSAGACKVATTFAHKALVLRKTRNEHAEEVFERSRQMLESCNIATIDCRYWFQFLLPSKFPIPII